MIEETLAQDIEDVEILENKTNLLETVKTEMELEKAEKQLEFENAVEEEMVAANAATQAENVKALLVTLSERRRLSNTFSRPKTWEELAMLMTKGNGTSKRISEEVSKSTTCRELLTMTEEMTAAYRKSTIEGMKEGSALAAAILENPPQGCSNEELDEIKAAETSLAVTGTSLTNFVAAKQKAVAEATEALATVTIALEEAEEELNLITEQLDEKKQAVEEKQNQLIEIISEINSIEIARTSPTTNTGTYTTTTITTTTTISMTTTTITEKILPSTTKTTTTSTTTTVETDRWRGDMEGSKRDPRRHKVARQ